MRYYSKLKDNYQRLDDSFNKAPTHVIDANLFITSLDVYGLKNNQSKHGSFTIIFSVWNSLLGASLVTIPWAFSNAGLVLGSLIIMLSFAISYYTCWLILKLAKDEEQDFTETLQRYFGKFGSYLGILSAIFALMIPLMFFFQIICQTLFPSIIAMTSTLQNPTIDLYPDFSKFSYSYTCLAIFALLFIVSLKKDLKIFIKINSFGVIFTIIIILFLIGVGVSALQDTNFEVVETYDNSQQNDIESESYTLQLYSLQFAPLMGIMNGGFYFHNLAIPILKNSSKKENNARDVFFGYFLALLSYLACGLLGYIGFSGKQFNHQPIEQNCLNMFTPNNPMAFIIRGCVAFLLITLFPLLLTIQKQQFWILYQKFKSRRRYDYKRYQKQITQRFSIISCIFTLIFITIIAIYYPKAGSLASILASIFCYFFVYLIPASLHIRQLYLDHYGSKQPDLNTINQNESIYSTCLLDKSINGQRDDHNQYSAQKSQANRNTLDRQYISVSPADLSFNIQKPTQSFPKTSILLIALDVLIMLYGLGVLALQYVKLQ
ncbi:UNKNOWN [Stylonychia lemnae]|uniref:Amino acid transporter transmembrane domain-containing protein n=1 Tax=Stylonychia lemnae TaxID=5949 RepID=A0A078AX56_STYLE|nr:UNKNOWN [Stylonychia lemnae]|eukprot:CDW86646.1 UNKNOWN [Stylonychia lemnae]